MNDPFSNIQFSDDGIYIILISDVLKIVDRLRQQSEFYEAQIDLLEIISRDSESSESFVP